MPKAVTCQFVRYFAAVCLIHGMVGHSVMAQRPTAAQTYTRTVRENGNVPWK